MVKEMTVGKHVMLVDDDDHEWLRDMKLQVVGRGYCQIYGPLKANEKRQLAHRAIMQRLGHDIDGKVIDHINHDTLDNRRENLRVCTLSQNLGNSKVQRRPNKSSIYKGVSWYKQRSKWGANIRVEGQDRFLGLFEHEDHAALAYNQAAREAWGEFALLNVIGEKPEVYTLTDLLAQIKRLKVQVGDLRFENHHLKSENERLKRTLEHERGKQVAIKWIET